MNLKTQWSSPQYIWSRALYECGGKCIKCMCTSICGEWDVRTWKLVICIFKSSVYLPVCDYRSLDYFPFIKRGFAKETMVVLTTFKRFQNNIVAVEQGQGVKGWRGWLVRMEKIADIGGWGANGLMLIY